MAMAMVRIMTIIMAPIFTGTMAVTGDRVDTYSGITTTAGSIMILAGAGSRAVAQVDFMEDSTEVVVDSHMEGVAFTEEEAAATGAAAAVTADDGRIT
jgi:hypothetical protein